MATGKRAHGDPSKLRRGRAKSKRTRPLTAVQERFCGKRALGIGVQGAAAEVYISFSRAWAWNRDPRIQARVEELRKQVAADLFHDELASYKLNLQHADVEVTRVASMEKPHAYRGFSDKTHAIELIYRRLKAIEPRTSVRATAEVGVGVIAGANMREVYKSRWLIEKEETLRKQLAATNPAPVTIEAPLPSTT